MIANKKLCTLCAACFLFSNGVLAEAPTSTPKEMSAPEESLEEYLSTPCNVLLAMQSPIFDPYFYLDTFDPTYFKDPDVDLQKAGQQFQALMSRVALSIVVDPEAPTARVPLRAMAILKLPSESPLQLRVKSGELPFFYWLPQKQVQARYDVLFRSYISPQKMIWGTRQIIHQFKTQSTQQITYRKIDFQLRVFVPQKASQHNELQLPFELIYRGHELVDCFSRSIKHLRYNHTHKYTQDQSSLPADAFEYADIMALEGGFKWPRVRRSKPVFARGVLHLKTSQPSLRAQSPAHMPEHMEFEFVSAAHEEPERWPLILAK